MTNTIWNRICLQCKRCRFDSSCGKIPWRRKWQPTPVFLTGEFHGQRRLVGYSAWDHKELDMTEGTEQQQQYCIHDLASATFSTSSCTTIQFAFFTPATSVFRCFQCFPSNKPCFPRYKSLHMLLVLCEMSSSYLSLSSTRIISPGLHILAPTLLPQRNHAWVSIGH